MNIILRQADFSTNNIGRIELPVVKDVNLINDDGSASSLILPPNGTESNGNPVVVNTVGETPLGQGVIHTLTYTRAVQTSSSPTKIFSFPFNTIMHSEYVGKTGFGFWLKYERPTSSSKLANCGISTQDLSATALAPTTLKFDAVTEVSTVTGSSYIPGTIKLKAIASKTISGETWYYLSAILDITNFTGGPYTGKQVIVYPAFDAYSLFFNNGGVGDILTVKIANVTYGYFDNYLDPEMNYPVF